MRRPYDANDAEETHADAGSAMAFAPCDSPIIEPNRADLRRVIRATNAALSLARRLPHPLGHTLRVLEKRISFIYFIPSRDCDIYIYYIISGLLKLFIPARVPRKTKDGLIGRGMRPQVVIADRR
jgi:hypothetical protein